MLSDVPIGHIAEDFVPGTDNVFDTVIQHERDDSDEDSLTVCDAGHSEKEEEIEEEEEEVIEDEQELIMPPKTKLPSFKEPQRASTQCDVSWEVLQPSLAYVDVEDPDVRKRAGILSRTGIVLRVDIPSGVAPESFQPEFSADGKSISFSCYMERSRYNPIYTLESNLQQSKPVLVGVQKACQDSWSYICRKNTTGETRDYRKYTVVLPEACEKEYRNPYKQWRINDVGKTGTRFFVSRIRSMFYYCFFFTEASKDSTPAMAAVDTLLRVDQTHDDNPMNDKNMSMANYMNQRHNDFFSPKLVKRSKKKRSSRKKKHHRRRSRRKSRRGKSSRRSRSYSSSSSSSSSYSSSSESEASESSLSIDGTMNNMSISNTTIPSLTPRASSRGTPRTRDQQSKDYNETTSQHRQRMKGKQRKVQEVVSNDEIGNGKTVNNPPPLNEIATTNNIFDPLLPATSVVYDNRLPLVDDDDDNTYSSARTSQSSKGSRSRDNRRSKSRRSIRTRNSDF